MSCPAATLLIDHVALTSSGEHVRTDLDRVPQPSSVSPFKLVTKTNIDRNVIAIRNHSFEIQHVAGLLARSLLRRQQSVNA